MDLSQTPGSQPVVYVLYGSDEFAMSQAVREMVSGMGDASMVELNTTRLDGRQVTPNEIYNSAAALPFLAARRLVIVDHALDNVRNDAAQEKFTAMLDKLPATAALVLLIEDESRLRKMDGKWVRAWEKLKQSHWLVRWTTQAKEKAELLAFPQPDARQMPDWVFKYTEKLGGKITRGAAASLASFVGSETRQASLEIGKLLDYVNYQRPAEEQDVNLLVTPGRHANVFSMVDSLAAGDARQALNMMSSLLEDDEPMAIFAMIIRQFRLLLQAREIMDEHGQKDQAMRELNQKEYVVDKLWEQARRFSMPRLEQVYHRLLEMDLEMKTKQTPAELLLDLFVSEMA